MLFVAGWNFVDDQAQCIKSDTNELREFDRSAIQGYDVWSGRVLCDPGSRTPQGLAPCWD
jgi:hypothetical protein